MACRPAGRRHFGSVRKLPSGRFQARYWHVGLEHVAPSTFTTKADALAWLSAAETDIHRGAWTAPKAGKVTLAEYGRAWLSARSDLRPVTRSKYEHMLERHVLPDTGPIRACSSPPVGRAVLVHGHARQVRDYGRRCLPDAASHFFTAVTDGLIVKSPCQVKGAGNARSSRAAGALGR